MGRLLRYYTVYVPDPAFIARMLRAMYPNPVARVNTEPSPLDGSEDSGASGLGPVRVITKINGWDEGSTVEVE